MRRFVLTLCVLGLAGSAFAFSLTDWQTSLYDQIKTDAAKNFSDLFRTTVTIEGSGGRVVGKIDLYGVTVPALGRAEKVVLHFNPFTYLYHRGDMIPALTKIEVLGAAIKIDRNQQGEWNFAKLLAPPEPGAPPAPLFSGLLTLKNCRLDYSDQVGFGQTQSEFSAGATDLAGQIDLRKKNQFSFKLDGKVPEAVKVRGVVDTTKGRYLINVSAADFALKKWVTYGWPLPGLTFKTGRSAFDFQVASPTEKNQPVSLSGKFLTRDVNLDYQSSTLVDGGGEILLDNNTLTANNFRGTVNQIPWVVEQGSFDLARRTADCLFSVRQGILYGQKFSLLGRLTYQDNLLTAEVSQSQLFGGKSTAGLLIDFSQKPPLLTADGKFSNIDLTSLAQGRPGIEGKGTGNFRLSGPLDNFNGEFKADLAKALVFGEPVEKLVSVFQVKSGDFYLKNLSVTSGHSSLQASGRISPDLTFSLLAEASGLRVKGKGFLGPMQATVEKFKGELGGKIDEKFLANPLRNLSASGEAVLSGGKVGDQVFTHASGKIAIGGGRIQIADAEIRQGETILSLSGQTGLGHPTNLRLAANPARLEDLGILNHFLPPEAKSPSGSVTIEVEALGLLPPDTRLTGLEPLLGLTVKGKILLANAAIAELPIRSTRIEFSWEDQQLKIPETKIFLPESDLTFRLDGQDRFWLKGVIDLSLLQALTEKYGKVAGLAGINLETAAGQVTASFWVDRLRFNEIVFDALSGSCLVGNNQLVFQAPLLIKSDGDLYSIAGQAPLSAEGAANLEVKIHQARLGSAYTLAEKLGREISRRFAGREQHGRVTIDPRRLSISGGLLKQAAVEKSAAPLISASDLGGDLSGKLTLKGRLADPTGSLTGTLKKGFFRNYTFDELTLLARLKNNTIKLERSQLLKGKGSLSARGNLELSGDVFLYLTADNMPLDILRIIFPAKEFGGYFNMNAGLDGPLDNPRVTLSAVGKNIVLAGVQYDSAVLSLSRKSDRFYLHELSLLHGNELSSAFGSWPQDQAGSISFEANLKGNTLGLLNLVTDDVKWLKGRSTLSAKINGTLERPVINGKISINAASVKLPKITSGLSNLSGEAVINNSQLDIRGLTGYWVGETTRNQYNPVGLAGTINLANLFQEKGSVDLNLVLSPTQLYLAFPKLYTGNLSIGELGLNGPLSFDLSAGPKLQGKAKVENAVLTITPPETAAAKIFPLRLDLDVDLAKNVYIVMGDIATLNLSSILMNLEVTGEKLKTAGNLAFPSLSGKVFLKRGLVNIFNREFTLLSPENQKKFFPYDSEKIRDNIAFFSGEEGPAGALPEIDLTSSVNVENQEKDAAGVYQKKTVVILARLTGLMGAKESERGLKISLAGFSEDKTKSPPELSPAAYSEQDLKVMLLPDFIKSLAGIGKPEETSKVDTNVVVADYISSRVQTLLFRSLEREAEQRLGLESLTLEYNLGPKVREAMGVTTSGGFEEEKPAWSVGFVKGVFDRLFVDVRYAQGMEQASSAAAKTAFNYQLTYKITPVWSIIYFREPLSLTELTTGYQKVTLKAGLSLW